MNPIIKKTLLASAAVAVAPLAIYSMFLLCLTNPWVQKQALYAHRVHTNWWHNLDDPETFGFAKNQVTPFQVKTPDGETLYAWHILPRNLYAKHEAELLQERLEPINNLKETLAYKLLKNDPGSRLVVNFHGNAGHLLQNTRPNLYTSLTSLSEHVHLIVFAYRGFPRSTGTPTELGLITDGISVLNYILTDLKVPANRIALTAQSLGTAVLSGVSSYLGTSPSESASSESLAAVYSHVEGFFPDLQRPIDFAAIILVCSFFDLRTNLLTYKGGGVVPFLTPLSSFPRIQKFITSFSTDTWDTKGRLATLVASALSSGNRHLNIKLIHALDDADIQCAQSEMIFDYVLAAGTKESESNGTHEEAGSKESGHLKQSHSWGDVNVALTLVRLGGHNYVPSSTNTAVAILEGLDLIQSDIGPV